MNVESLHIYPLKSGAGVTLGRARADERGFHRDRRLMAVDQDGNFISQRTHPLLGYVQVQFTDAALQLQAPGEASLFIDVPHTSPTEVTIWGDTVQASELGPDATAWLSAFLGEDVRLVQMPESSIRPVSGHDVAVSFADGYPYLLTTTASLDDLNARIPGDPVPMLAFRPNIVVAGSEPWAEDSWSRIRIGDAEFELAGPCVRCKVPTLDPDAPDRRRLDGEPLRTLATFRRHEGGVIFGENLICRTPGVMIRRGDDVEILE
jgi:uncharacterized protein YcbX